MKLKAECFIYIYAASSKTGCPDISGQSLPELICEYSEFDLEHGVAQLV
jgi:hypothetical protein